MNTSENPTEELSCREVVGLVTDYLEQVLLPQTQEQLEAHLAECPGCVTYLRQIQQTITMLRALADEPALLESKAALLQLFARWKQGPDAHTPLPTDSADHR